MDEGKAVKTLTVVLVERLGSQVVQDDFYKEKLIKEAEYFFQLDDPFIMGFDRFYMKDADSGGKYHRWGFVGEERTEKECHNVYSTIKNVIDAEGKYQDANYFFVGKPEGDKDKGVNFFVTPYSIIGKKEIDNLRNLFYKNLPPDIISAMHTLKITDYTELYKLYSSKRMEGEFLEGYHAYLALERILAKFYFERTDASIKQSKIEALVGMSVEDFNKKLDKNVKPIVFFGPYSKGEERCTVKARIEQTKDESKAYSQFGKWVNFLSGFFEFAFSMPLEDQNMTANMEILKLFAGEIDFIGILAKEYSSGKNFKNYFSRLDAQKQEKVVDSLKVLQERNSEDDAFLWSKGFKNIGMDYLKFYKEDADTFIDYFKNRSQDEKKVIMEDIMGCEYINEKAIEWLNKNEADLIREVGLSDG